MRCWSLPVEHPDTDPMDPDWTQFEKPEMMLTVEDKEVSFPDSTFSLFFLNLVLLKLSTHLTGEC